MIRKVRLFKTGTGVTNAIFKLRLYRASPASTFSNGDGGAWLSAGGADYIGAMDVNVNTPFTDGAAGIGVPSEGSDINFKLPSGTSLYGVLVAAAAYTPVSAEGFTVALEIIQD